MLVIKKNGGPYIHRYDLPGEVWNTVKTWPRLCAESFGKKPVMKSRYWKISASKILSCLGHGRIITMSTICRLLFGENHRGKDRCARPI